MVCDLYALSLIKILFGLVNYLKTGLWKNLRAFFTSCFCRLPEPVGIKMPSDACSDFMQELPAAT
jgi:hypothetical protein